MDPYSTLAALIGWPAVVALLLIVGGYGYWVLQNRIETLKEKNDYLEKQNSDLKELRPDVLAERQAKRLELLTDELGRLHQDEVKNRELIEQKEEEIKIALAEMRNLHEELEKAQSAISRYDTIINQFHLTEFIYGVQEMLEITSMTLSQIEKQRSPGAEGAGIQVPNWEDNMIHELVSELAEKASEIHSSVQILLLLNSDASEYTRNYLDLETTILGYLKRYVFMPTKTEDFPSFKQMRELKTKLSELRDIIVAFSKDKKVAIFEQKGNRQ